MYRPDTSLSILSRVFRERELGCSPVPTVFRPATRRRPEFRRAHGLESTVELSRFHAGSAMCPQLCQDRRSLVWSRKSGRDARLGRSKVQVRQRGKTGKIASGEFRTPDQSPSWRNPLVFYAIRSRCPKCIA